VSVYTKRLYGPNQWGTTAVTSMSTVPAGKVWVVRSLIVVSRASTAGQVFVLFLGGTSNDKRVWRSDLVANQTLVVNWRLQAVAGETFYGQWAVQQPVVTLVGYEFDA